MTFEFQDRTMTEQRAKSCQTRRRIMIEQRTGTDRAGSVCVDYGGGDGEDGDGDCGRCGWGGKGKVGSIVSGRETPSFSPHLLLNPPTSPQPQPPPKTSCSSLRKTELTRRVQMPHKRMSSSAPTCGGGFVVMKEVRRHRRRCTPNRPPPAP